MQNLKLKVFNSTKNKAHVNKKIWYMNLVKVWPDGVVVLMTWYLKLLKSKFAGLKTWPKHTKKTFWSTNHSLIINISGQKNYSLKLRIYNFVCSNKII